MGADALLKRYFWVVAGVLLAIAAYFQASGLGQLVASSVAVEPGASRHSTAQSLPSHAPTSTDHSTSAKEILARNPFDSVTGPLDGSSVEMNIPPPTAPDSSNLVDDPPCDVAKVLLITESEDPAWSFAAIAGPDGKPVLRRQGDEVSGHTVYFIGWNRVWLAQGGSRCQMIIGGKQVVKTASTAASSPISETDRPSKKGKKVPPEIASKITKVSENEFNVERSVVDQILENQAELMRSARIVPEKEGDKIVGIRLFGIRSDSLLGTLGLENGDRLQTINGFDMSSPEKALEAYARLRTADHLTVTVNRRGKNQNLDFNIK